jgi:(1->4)-alpha-D-glucan 1-alpha-D-glucosylmutase
MQKAVREAKVHSSWVNPNPEYDYAVSAFVERVLVDRPDDKFLSDFFSLRDFVAYYGMLNSLAWRLVHLMAPGFPDLYQGSELWNFDLVDPDNRRPVDYARPREYLAEIRAELDGAYDGETDHVPRALLERLLATWTDGRIKLYVTHVALRERRRHPDVFVAGHYVPLNVVGPSRDHIVGFARTGSNVDIVTIVPRLSAGLTRESLVPPIGPDVWGETKIHLGKPGRLLNLMTGDVFNPIDDDGEPAILAAQVFSTFPVALLRREAACAT